MELWMRPNSISARHQLIDKSGEYRVAFVYGMLVVDLRDNSSGARASVYSNVNLSSIVGGWHHVAVSYDGRGGATAANGITVYLDGAAIPVQRENSASYVAMENLANPVQFGRSSSGEQYTGGLDDIRLWNVNRTSNQILLTMGAELTGLESGLVAYWRFNDGSGLSGVDDSPNNHVATLVNGTLWMPDGPLAPDATAPLISNIVVSNVTSSGATITFTTDETATAWVSHTTTVCPCTDVFSGAVGTAHSVNLTGLAANTTYNFTVSARDGANNLRTSTSMNFHTLVQVIDTLAPTVTFVTPPAGVVSGTVMIEATASDNVGVTSVEFKLGGVSLAAPDTAAPYQLQVDTTLLADGAYTLTAEARDASNNLGTASRSHHVSLDGVNDAVTAGDTNALSFGTGAADTPFTVELWMQPDVISARHQLIGKASEYRVAFVYGTLVVDLRDNSAGARASVYSSGSLSSLVGGWHHLAVSYDGRGGAAAADGVTVYLDGAAIGLQRQNAATYVAMENLTNPIEIGRSGPNTEQYDGTLDEIRVWRVARTGANIQATMGAELTGAEAGLAAYWRFNEGAGTSVADDSVGTATATLVNGTAWLAGGPLTPDTTAPVISNVAVSNRRSPSRPTRR
jgi:hypothetical protein